jgi:hypothetical protein
MTRERLIIVALAVALALSLSAHLHSAPVESAGERLRRECTSIVKEANRDLDLDEWVIEQEVSHCIETRGLAGR